MSDDIVHVLRSMAAAYPEDIFPVPPPEKQAKDGAAAHVLRRVAVPHFTAAADEIERLRHSLAGVLDWADRHRISWPEHDHDCFEEWCAERDYARTLLPDDGEDIGRSRDQ